MHILFLTDNFPPETNAAAARVYERACYWIKWGFQVTVITSAPNFPQGKVYPPYKNRWYQTEEMNGIRVIRVKTFMAANQGFFLRVLDFSSYMVMAILAGLWPKRPNVIVATSPQFFCAIAGWFLAAVRRKSFVFELSDLWPDSITAVTGMQRNPLIRLLEAIELFLYRRAKAVVALTHAFKENLISRGIVADKIYVVRNGVDLSRYRRQEKNPALLQQYNLVNKFVVGYIGTHGMAHALMNVLQAAQLLKNQEPSCVFMLVGDGAERADLLEKARQLQLNNLIFISPQDKATIPQFWSLCDVALVHLKNSPVFNTVIPSKIFEAMAMELPIIFAGPTGEATQIIQQHQVGLCVPAENPEKLAEAVLLLNNQPTLAAQLSHNSKISASYYQREQQAKKFIQVLQGIV